MPDILNLPYVKVISVIQNAHDYFISAETTVPPVACPKCSNTNFVKYGVRKPIFMDLPIHAMRVGIEFVRQRYICRSCTHVFIDPMTGMDETRMMTTRLLQFIRTQSLKRTFTSIADDIGVHEKTVRNVFMEYAKELSEKYVIDTPEWLGIDEIYIVGRPRFVLTNVQQHTLIDMLKTRNKPLVEHHLQHLPNRSKIQVVTMDMWLPYKDAVTRTLPQAKIIIDRYHVVSMANKAVDDYRKSIKGAMQLSQRRQLMRDRYILLKRKRDLKERDLLLLSTWTENYPKLAVAHALKESFCNLYDLPSKQEAKDQYALWSDSIQNNDEYFPYFKDLIRAMGNWDEHIFNYFDVNITNGYTEAMNGLIKIANRIGRGYSFEAIRTKMLFRDGHLMKSKPKFDHHPAGNNLGMVTFNQPDDFETPVSYGIPISTLTQMIMDGEI